MIDLRLSDSERHYYLHLKQLTRDGVDLNVVLQSLENIPHFHIRIDGLNIEKWILLFPKAFQFLLLYLLTGDNSNFPKYPKNREIIDFKTEDDYRDYY